MNDDIILGWDIDRLDSRRGRWFGRLRIVFYRRRGAMTDVWNIVLLVIILIALAIPSAILVWCYVDELNRESERYGRWWR